GNLDNATSQSFTFVDGMLPAAAAPNFLAGDFGENHFGNSVPSGPDTGAVNGATSQSFTFVDGTLPAAAAPNSPTGHSGQGLFVNSPISGAGIVNDAASKFEFIAGISAPTAEPTFLAEHFGENHLVDSLLSDLRNVVAQELPSAAPELHDT